MMEKRTPTVAVLMSTYNGEAFIRQQLDSIFTQEGVCVKLFVRDDGSSDNTVSILREYAKRYPITIIQDGENVGPGESFMRLVYMHAEDPDIEFYAFADQDDIWLEDKLSNAVKSIFDYGYTTPVLYASNQYLFVNGINEGYRHKERQNVDLISHMTKNTISGCTFVFNKELARLIYNAGRPDQRIIDYRLHDAWIMLIAIACGHVIYDEEARMLYRIHSGNTVGVKKVSLHEKMIRLNMLLRKKGNANIRMVTAKELLRLFSECIGNDDKEILNLYANYQRSLHDRIQLVTNKNVIQGSFESPLVFSLKAFLNFI